MQIITLLPIIVQIIILKHLMHKIIILIKSYNLKICNKNNTETIHKEVINIPQIRIKKQVIIHL